MIRAWSYDDITLLSSDASPPPVLRFQVLGKEPVSSSNMMSQSVSSSSQRLAGGVGSVSTWNGDSIGQSTGTPSTGARRRLAAFDLVASLDQDKYKSDKHSSDMHTDVVTKLLHLPDLNLLVSTSMDHLIKVHLHAVTHSASCVPPLESNIHIFPN